jgi:Zn-dependent protease with chaperone function
MTEIEDLLRRLRVPSIPTLALYAATVVAELPVMLGRMLVVFAVAVVVLLVKGHFPPVGAEGYAELAVIPTGWAIFALITPLGGGWWWRTNLGGREPSERERAAYHEAIQLLLANSSTPLRLPSTWFVLDDTRPDAAVCGDALMLSRGLFDTDYLPAVLAHELGHLLSSDGKLTAAINRLIINPLPNLRHQKERRGNIVVLGGDRLVLTVTLFGALLWLARAAIRFARGGLGLRFLAPAWGSYWREREYLADQHAARLGQADELADFLELHALIHDQPVPFIWLTEHTHPPTELRIDRLRKAASGSVATGAEPVKAAPAGPPAAGPDGPTLTEPTPSAERSLRSAGQALPTTRQHPTMEGR